MKKPILTKLLDEGYSIQLEWCGKRKLGRVYLDSKIIYINFWLAIFEILLHEYIHTIMPYGTPEEVIEKKLNTMLLRISGEEIVETAEILLKKYCGRMKNISSKGDTCPLIMIQVGVSVPCCFPDLPECKFYSSKGQDNESERIFVGCKWQELERQYRESGWKK